MRRTRVIQVFLGLAVTLALGAAPAVAARDVVGDAIGRADIRGFTVLKSGRGVAFTWIFAKVAPRPSRRTGVCARTNYGRVCVAPDGRHVRVGRRTRDARVVRAGRRIRAWVRASALGVPSGKSVVASAWVHVVLDRCALPCTDTSSRVRAVYRAPSTCRARPGVWRHGPTRERLVALTFDDGPHPATTAVLNALRSARAPATFYVGGALASARPDALRRMRREGHDIAIHSWNHEYKPSSWSMRSTQALVERITGFRPCTFRPPYGALDSAQVARAWAYRLATVMWSVDPFDWQTQSTSTTIARASIGGPGAIVLLHDGGGGNWATARAVPQIIRNYRARGFRLVTVDELLRFQPS